MTPTAEPTPRPLDYAPRPAPRGLVPGFRVGAFAAAVCGVAANVVLIVLVVTATHRARWAHHDLMQNPRAYGRTITPQTIASLRNPIDLWVSHGLLLVAAAFGLLLAVSLLSATVRMRRDPHGSSHRLRSYARLKPVGAAATALAFFWGPTPRATRSGSPRPPTGPSAAVSTTRSGPSSCSRVPTSPRGG